jgi:chemotaxis protein MotB
VLSALKQELEAEIAALTTQLDSTQGELVRQTELGNAATAQVELLNRQMAAIREQLGKLEAALGIANRDLSGKDAKIADLGRQLNLALANRVGELERYRSEFFGKLREALGDRSDVQIAGDRFIVPTDILFESGSAELGDAAQDRLQSLAATVREVSAEIPSSIDWVLRIDGHTDRRPIHTARFPSNWELSTARAVAIVKYLVVQGIPAHRLSANGFGQFQPLDSADGPEAYARNRRIELQLTNR